MPRILLIDDEKVLRQMIRLMLERSGHEVEEAADGDEGLRAFRERRADVVLCDLFMPGREGMETITELRRAGARVVAMSGGGVVGAMGLLDVAVAMGACSALPKPFGRQQLLDAVAGALASGDGPPRPLPREGGGLARPSGYLARE
jgi:CheY-like chemotaxis protein